MREYKDRKYAFRFGVKRSYRKAAAKSPTIARAEPALAVLAPPVKVGTEETVLEGGEIGVAVAEPWPAPALDPEPELKLPGADVGAPPDPEE